MAEPQKKSAPRLAAPLAALLITLLTALQLLLFPAVLTYTGGTAFAKDITDTQNLKNIEFDVIKYLKLGDQTQSYFTEQDPSKGESQFPVVTFILDVIDLAVKIAGTIAVLMLILTGFVMIFSQGNQNIIEKAKQMFLYEVIGTAVIFLSYVLVTIVQGIFTI